MSEKVNLHVGSIDEMDKRFVDAWRCCRRAGEGGGRGGINAAQRCT